MTSDNWSGEPLLDLAVHPERQIRVELDVDAEMLLEAQRQIGAESLDDAVNAALVRLVEQERAKRMAAQARLKQMYEDGHLDFSQIEDRDR